MTKREYIVEMLDEILRHYQISPEVLQQCAQDVIDGLDVWYELSGDAVASNNRYAAVESEKEQAVKRKQKEIDQAEKKHKEELEEIQSNARWMRQSYQRRIEELEKQIK